MFALAYAPAVIGAAIIIFDKKYIAGFTLTAFFTALQIAMGHQQIRDAALQMARDVRNQT